MKSWGLTELDEAKEVIEGAADGSPDDDAAVDGVGVGGGWCFAPNSLGGVLGAAYLALAVVGTELVGMAFGGGFAGGGHALSFGVFRQSAAPCPFWPHEAQA